MENNYIIPSSSRDPSYSSRYANSILYIIMSLIDLRSSFLILCLHHCGENCWLTFVNFVLLVRTMGFKPTTMLEVLG